MEFRAWYRGVSRGFGWLVEVVWLQSIGPGK